MSDKSVSNIKQGDRRRRKAWTTQFTQVTVASTLDGWLFEISQLLAIPEYATAVVTRVHASSGKPLEVQWKKDHASFLKNVTILSGTSRMVPESLFPLVKKLQREIEDPLMYRVQDGIVLCISTEQICTGGIDTGERVYETGLLIRIAQEFDLADFVKRHTES